MDTLKQQLDAITVDGVCEHFALKKLLQERGLNEQFEKFMDRQTIPMNGFYRHDVEKFLYVEQYAE